METKKILLSVLLFFTSFIFSCNEYSSTEKKEKQLFNDLEVIKKRGKLVAVTDYNSVSYFLYKGKPMGFQFELLQELSNHLGIKLEIKVNNDLESSFLGLKTGEYDLIATNLTKTRERLKKVLFTEPIMQSRQVLVQRKPEGWQNMTDKDMDNKLIRNQLELGGKVVHVQKNSSHASRLYNLSEEIGDSIKIAEFPDVETEELIAKVAKGEIDYTVCDNNIAMVNQMYYNNIDIHTAVSFPQHIAWAVRKESRFLADDINDWLKKFKTTNHYKNIYSKYFERRRGANFVQEDYFYALEGGNVSPYDELIKEYSKEIGWDWRLLASLIYQESRFKPEVKSWAGAYGLMQLMPGTAEHFGVEYKGTPSENIKGGVRFIKWLDKKFTLEINNEEEKIKFILASYNVGLGHVQDARRLAEKNGKDPNRWDENVDFYVLNKSKPEYYTDKVVKYGYCRGSEPYYYVKEIIDRYQHYKNVLK